MCQYENLPWKKIHLKTLSSESHKKERKKDIISYNKERLKDIVERSGIAVR